MEEARELRDLTDKKTNKKIFPITHTDAVLDNEGNNMTETLYALKGDLNKIKSDFNTVLESILGV